MRILLVLTAIIALFTHVAEGAAAAWSPPVAGAVTRWFDPGRHPFEGGRHRGVDLAAQPGTTVRSPCAGQVAFAGRVGTSGRVVTLRCGAWRVTHMPLGSIAVREGAPVGPGAPVGTVAASAEHAGLHLGVRRDGTRFGYADPLRFLAPGSTITPPPLGPAPRPARPPRPSAPRPPAPRPPAPRPHPVAAPPRALTDSNPQRAPFAPWPAWVGSALVLAGAGVRVRARSRKAHAPAAAGTLAR